MKRNNMIQMKSDMQTTVVSVQGPHEIVTLLFAWVNLKCVFSNSTYSVYGDNSEPIYTSMSLAGS